MWNKFYARCDGTHSFVLVWFPPQNLMVIKLIFSEPKMSHYTLFGQQCFFVCLFGVFFNRWSLPWMAFLLLLLSQKSEACTFSDVVVGSFVASCMLHVCVCVVLLLGWPLLISLSIVPTFLWRGSGSFCGPEESRSLRTSFMKLSNMIHVNYPESATMCFNVLSLFKSFFHSTVLQLNNLYNCTVFVLAFPLFPLSSIV